MEQMSENAANKKEILSDLIAKESAVASSLSDSSADSGTDSSSQASGDDDPREMSEWEKKLEKLG